MRGSQNSDDVQSLRTKRDLLGKQKIMKSAGLPEHFGFTRKIMALDWLEVQVTGPLCFSIEAERQLFTGCPHAMVAWSEPLYGPPPHMFPNLSTVTCAATGARCWRLTQCTIHCIDKVMAPAMLDAQEVASALPADELDRSVRVALPSAGTTVQAKMPREYNLK
jgi:hypothetical protein